MNRKISSYKQSHETEESKPKLESDFEINLLDQDIDSMNNAILSPVSPDKPV